MLGSSLIVRNWEIGDEVTIQQDRVASFEGEMTQAQKLASELEEQLVIAQAREQQAIEELKKITEDRNAIVARSEKQLAHAQKLSIEEFRAFDDF